MKNPITGMLQRFLPRANLAPGHIEGGQTGRRLAAIPSTTMALNTLISRYGRAVVARSRYLCLNNPYAVSAKETYVAAVAGFGIKPSSLSTDSDYKAALQQLWLDWTAEADADGITDYYGMQALAASELFEAGEVFAVKTRTPMGQMDTGIPLRIRLVPSEMLPLTHNEPRVAGGNRIVQGIEFDAAGNRVRYHFLKVHPGGEDVDATGYGTHPVDAADVMHVFKPIRVGQVRGLPHTLSAILTAATLDLYDDAELERKRVAALFAAFVRTPAVEGDDDAGTHPLGSTTRKSETDQFIIEPGATIDLLPGEEVTFSSPSDVGQQYEAFQYRNLLRMAAGMGVPYANMTGDLRQANYGSIRAGLVEFRRRVTAVQHGTVIHQLCRPVWRAFHDAAALAGVHPMARTEYLANRAEAIRAKHITPTWDWVDPLKDRQAEKLAVDNGFKPRSDVIEAEGYDPEEVDNRIAADQERADRLGLRLAQPDTGEEDLPVDRDGQEQKPAKPQETPDGE